MLHIGRKSEKLIPRELIEEAQTLQWTISALNSIEMVSVPWWFLEVTGAKENGLTEWLASRLNHMEGVLKEREWLVANRFTVADLLMADVLRVEKSARLEIDQLLKRMLQESRQDQRSRERTPVSWHTSPKPTDRYWPSLPIRSRQRPASRVGQPTNGRFASGSRAGSDPKETARHSEIQWLVSEWSSQRCILDGGNCSIDIGSPSSCDTPAISAKHR